VAARGWRFGWLVLVFSRERGRRGEDAAAASLLRALPSSLNSPLRVLLTSSASSTRMPPAFSSAARATLRGVGAASPTASSSSSTGRREPPASGSFLARSRAACRPGGADAAAVVAAAAAAMAPSSCTRAVREDGAARARGPAGLGLLGCEAVERRRAQRRESGPGTGTGRRGEAQRENAAARRERDDVLRPARLESVCGCQFGG